MTATLPTKWFFEADYFQACNCDYGCPCEFEAPPTQGFCEGLGAWRINDGKFGDIALNGLGIAFAINFPGPMHKGNGTGVFFIDQRADPPQRQAILEILSGKHGYSLFEIFSVIVTRKLPPVFAPFDFIVDGKRGGFRIGDGIAVRFDPIKNPVNGQPEEIRIEHGTGFLFKSAECVSATENRMTLGDWSFSHPAKAGFISKIRYGN
jgi:hypothetical protein